MTAGAFSITGFRVVSSLKQIKLAAKSAANQRQVIAELDALAEEIERSEKTIAAVHAELGQVNAKYQGQRTTRQDVEYLTALLDCAKKKLLWEKQISSLRKRTPALLETMARLLNDPDYPPADEVKNAMLRGLQAVQSALERLQPSGPEEDEARN